MIDSNLRSLNEEEMAHVVKEMKAPRFRAKQLFEW